MHIVAGEKFLCKNVHMSLKFVLLTMLNRESRSGYDLVRTFDTAVGYFWNASHQQVYRELAALTDARLVKFRQVKQEDKPDKKIYSLTLSGQKALQQWLETPLKSQKSKDLLLVKLLNAGSENLTLFTDELERNIESSLELQATYLEIEKNHYSAKQRRSLQPDQIMIYVALRKGILSIEAHLSWLRETKKLLAKTFDA